MKQMYVYIMANRPEGITYIGVTNDLIRRTYEHRNHLIKGFTDRYNLTKLVYYEVYDSELIAIKREKTLKHYTRQKKLNIVNSANPKWDDLYTQIC